MDVMRERRKNKRSGEEEWRRGEIVRTLKCKYSAFPAAMNGSLSSCRPKVAEGGPIMEGGVG